MSYLNWKIIIVHSGFIISVIRLIRKKSIWLHGPHKVAWWATSGLWATGWKALTYTIHHVFLNGELLFPSWCLGGTYIILCQIELCYTVWFRILELWIWSVACYSELRLIHLYLSFPAFICSCCKNVNKKKHTLPRLSTALICEANDKLFWNLFCILLTFLKCVFSVYFHPPVIVYIFS